MARILYGVHGSQHGHAIRALTIARAFPEHEFVFATSEDAAHILSKDYEVITVKNPGTRYKNYCLDMPATLKLAADAFAHTFSERDKLVRLIDKYKPDMAITDYEFFVPLAAKKTGLPCLSIDHQHIITNCRHQIIPRAMWWDLVSTSFSVNNLFSNADAYLIISFFAPPVKSGVAPTRIIPPILREKVLERSPSRGDHILAYQSCSIREDFLPFLNSLGRDVILYGFKRDEQYGRVRLKSFSEDGLLDDMASSAYVIAGGGHTLMSEALYYGKPIVSLPVRGAFEQSINALYLEHLSLGQRRDMFSISQADIEAFELRLEDYRAHVERTPMRGNELAFDLIRLFLANGRLPPW